MLKLRLNSWRSTMNLSTQYDWNVKMFSIQIEAEYVRGVRTVIKGTVIQTSSNYSYLSIDWRRPLRFASISLDEYRKRSIGQ